MPQPVLPLRRDVDYSRHRRQSQHHRRLAVRIGDHDTLRERSPAGRKEDRSSRRASPGLSSVECDRKIQLGSPVALLVVPRLGQRRRRIAHQDPSLLLLRHPCAVSARYGVVIETGSAARSHGDGSVLPRPEGGLIHRNRYSAVILWRPQSNGCRAGGDGRTQYHPSSSSQHSRVGIQVPLRARNLSRPCYHQQRRRVRSEVDGRRP